MGKIVAQQKEAAGVVPKRLSPRPAGKAASPKRDQSVGTKAGDDDYVVCVEMSAGTFDVTVKCDGHPQKHILEAAIEHTGAWPGEKLCLATDHRVKHFRRLVKEQEPDVIFDKDAQLFALTTGRCLIPTKGMSAVIEVFGPDKWNVYRVDTFGQITRAEYERTPALPPNQEGLHKAAKRAAPSVVYGTYLHHKSGTDGLYYEYGYAERENTWEIKPGETDYLTLRPFGRGAMFTAEEDESGRLVLHSVMAKQLQAMLDAEPDFLCKVDDATAFLKGLHPWLESDMQIDESMDNMDDLERLETALAHLYDWDKMTPHPWYFEYCELRKILEDLSESRPKQ